MNNARYFELIDTVVNNHLAAATGTDIRRLPAIGVVAEVSCRYFAEVGYPEPVDLGLVVERVGTRSEEHTSELQSLMRNSYAVFCLKKKKDRLARHLHST